MSFRTGGTFTANVGENLDTIERLAALPSLIESYHFNADLGATVAAGKVVSVSSDVTATRILTQGAGANQPGYAVNALHGLPVVDIDGVNDFLQYSAAVDLTKAHTWVVVAHADAVANQVLMRSGSGAGNEEYIFFRNTAEVSYILGDRSITVPYVGGYNLLVCASDGAGRLKMWANGRYFESNTAPGNNSVPNNGQPILGTYTTADPTTLPFNGQVAWLARFGVDIFADEPKALARIREHVELAFGLTF